MYKRVLLIILVCFCFIPSCVRRPRHESMSRRTRVSIELSHTMPQSRQGTVSPGEAHGKSVSGVSVELSGVQIYDRYNSAVFMVYTSDGHSTYQGSGFFINSTGLAVSNYHVFQGTSVGREVIQLSNGEQYHLKRVIAKDEYDDIFIFEIDAPGHSFNYIPIADSTPKVGEKAYSIGSPKGLENTFSSGEVSQIRDGGFIQISVPIDHGSSGGALINSYGQAIGITSGGFEGSNANLNYAMDIQLLRKYISIE